MKKNNSKKWYWIKFFLGIFIASIVLVALSVSLVLHIYRGGDSEVVVDMNISSEEIVRGQPFNIEISAINNTSGFISSGSFSINLSDGLINLGHSDDFIYSNEETGDISSGSLVRRTFTILPVAKEGSKENIDLVFSYNFGRASFSEHVEKSVEIEDELIDITIEPEDQLVVGSSADIIVGYMNSGDINLNDLSLEVNYPDSFNFSSANISPDSLNNYWNLGALVSGSEGEISISGFLDNVSGEQNFTASMYLNVGDSSFVIAEETLILDISSSPVELDIDMTGQPSLGNNLVYTISYQNNSGVMLRDVVITVDLIGDLFNISELSTDGFVDDALRRVTWNHNNDSGLSLIESGEKGFVEIEIPILSTFPVSRLSDKNFTLIAEAKFESPSVPFYLDADSLISQSSLETKVSGHATIESKAFFRDSDSGVINEGSLPPKVGESIQFTVHWLINNFFTDIRDVEVRASLPEGVEWVESVFSNVDDHPVYEESSGEIIWRIPSISANRGILNDPIKAVFQVEATPQENDIDQFHSILTRTFLGAEDEWTGRSISNTSIPLDTQLIHDPTVGTEDGIVVE